MRLGLHFIVLSVAVVVVTQLRDIAFGQALKSVEKATHQKIKEVEIRAQITKARKTYWFEKVQTPYS